MKKEEVFITNPRRRKQIEEFEGRDSKVMSEYYDLMNSGLKSSQLKKEMQRLIEQDPLFLDPYLILGDILIVEGKHDEAKRILKEAYLKAMRLIADKDGNWPKSMPWGILENRHIVRAINRWAYELWVEGESDFALEIFRRLLRSNPGDNIGARYSILAIRMGYEPDYTETMFPSDMPGCWDGAKVAEWFDKNAKNFPEEFDWWFKEIEEEY